MAKNSVSFGKSKYIEAVDALAAIVAQVAAVQGTQAEVMKKVQAQALMAKAPNLDLAPPAGDDLALVDLAAWHVHVGQVLAQAQEEAETALYAARPKGVSLDALKEQYADQLKMVDAMGTLMAGAKIDVSDVPIPALSKSRKGGGSSGPRPVKTSGMVWYTGDVGGPDVPMSDDQNKHSSMAWYHGAALVPSCPDDQRTNKGKGVPAKVLTDALVSQGFNPVKPWEITVGGRRFGLKIVAADESPAEG